MNEFCAHAKGVVPTALVELIVESAGRVLAELDSLERDIDARVASVDASGARYVDGSMRVNLPH